ncbi:neurochondrin family protein [Tasmannia lanceolata]|uniref:neurochondrin family protein n=1 Tax=Tasmannia lanceolata TaxID=3420 RepID=UPI004064B984
MESVPGLEDCLKLLKGERDEQRLAGLLLATKFCKSDDQASIIRVYNAVGIQFLDRLLMTGMGKGTVGAKEGDDREAYLRLSVTVIAAFCHVREIASSKEMVSKVPVILELMSKMSGSSIFEECYEFLLLVATASEDGLTTLYESGAIKVLASHISTMPDGSLLLELALRLLQLLLSKLPLDIINIEYPSELSCMVAAIAKQFAILHNTLKFDALRLLSVLLSSKYAATLHDALRSMSSGIWTTYIRIGIVAILQNRVASAEKLRALVLAESMMSIIGESWLLDQTNLPGDQDPIPVDRCLLLVLESARVEVAVLLNEVAYLRYEASKSSSTTAGTILLKQRDLAISFSLIEKIIKLISNLCGAEDSPISESTSIKLIAGLNETAGVVLDFLQDAKDHGQKKGDDLLASVRILGSYLAETPCACKEKVQELLEYILSIEGEDEPSPFYSICFMLPMLCQTTMEIEGCRALTSFGGHKDVVECLVKLIGMNKQGAEDNGTIFLSCDTLMNILLKREEIRAQLDESNFTNLLRALAYWTGSNDSSIIMMFASICALVFDLTSEESLLNRSNFDTTTLNCLAQIIVRSLDTSKQGEMGDDFDADLDLHQIVTEGYSRWADRFPLIKQAVETSTCLHQ